MKKGIKILIVTIIVLLIVSLGTVAGLYFFTDMFKTNKQMYMKYISEMGKSVYSELNDEKLKEYKEKTKNTPYETNGEISTKGRSWGNLDNLNISFNGKVDVANKYYFQNIKVNNSQIKDLSADLLIQDQTLGFKINGILNGYIAIKNENLKALAKELGIKEEQLEYIPDKIEFNNDIESIVTKEEVNELKEKYGKLLSDSLNDDMFSKINKDDETIYSLKLNDEQLDEISNKILENVKDDEMLWGIIKKYYLSFGIVKENEIDKQIEELKEKLQDDVNDIKNNNENNSDETKENKTYEFNLHVKDKKVYKIEILNGNYAIILNKTNNGITYNYQEKEKELSKVEIEKSRENNKLVYNIKILEDGKEFMSVSIEYKGIDSQNEVQEALNLTTNNNSDALTIFDNSMSIKYNNTIKFNENLAIEKAKDNEFVYLNGKSAEYIQNLFTNIIYRLMMTGR